MTDATHTPHGEGPTSCPTCRAALRPGTQQCPMCGTRLGDSLHPATELSGPTLPDTAPRIEHGPEADWTPAPWAPVGSSSVSTPPTGDLPSPSSPFEAPQAAPPPSAPPPVSGPLPASGPAPVSGPPPPPSPPPPVSVVPPPPAPLPPLRLHRPRRPQSPLTARGIAAAVAAFAAGIALVVAAFLPWMSSGGTHVNGWHLTGDARVLLVVGVIAIVLGSAILAGFGDSPAVWVLLAAGAAISAAYAVADIVDIAAGNVRHVAGGHVHLGPGPWLVVGAAVVLMISAVLAATRRADTSPADGISGNVNGA